MRTLDFGKHSGKCLQECDDSYLKWLVSHEKVLAKRNRWASRDAQYILARREGEKAAQAVAASKIERLEQLAAEGNFMAAMDLRMTKFIVSNKVESTDLGTKGHLNGNQGFSILRR